MITPWQRGLIKADPKLSCQFIAEDIEVLNLKAIQGYYAISAISAAMYPKIQHRYRILTLGASFGGNHGPAIITHRSSGIKNLAELGGKILAVPGLRTSAYATARMVLPDFVSKSMPFDQIAGQVENHACDGGLLIHELQLATPPQLVLLGNLGTLWQITSRQERFRQDKHHAGHPVSNKTSDYLLPLGLIVIRRDISLKDQRLLSQTYTESIAYGWQHRHTLLSQISTQLNTDLTPEILEHYWQNYVGPSATVLTALQRESLKIWWDIGAQMNLWDQVDTDACYADNLQAS